MIFNFKNIFTDMFKKVCHQLGIDDIIEKKVIINNDKASELNFKFVRTKK